MATPPPSPAPTQPAATPPPTTAPAATAHPAGGHVAATVAHPTGSHAAATVAHHAATVAHHAVTVAHHAASRSSLTGAQNVSASSLLVQMVVGLAVIIVLIKVASRLVRGRGGGPLGHGPRSQGVSVVGRQSLGKGVQVAMVTAGRQTYLLGVTQRQVTLLGEVDTTDPVVVSVGTGPAAAGQELTSAAPAALPAGLATLSMGSTGSATATNAPAWKSAIEQMRVRTTRRA